MPVFPVRGIALVKHTVQYIANLGTDRARNDMFLDKSYIAFEGGGDTAEQLQSLLARVSGEGFEEFTLMCEDDQRQVLELACRLSHELNTHP